MKLPSSTDAIREFEVWALPPTNGLKESLIVKRYNDSNVNAAFQGFLQCYYWLESEFKKQQGKNTPDVLQNAKKTGSELLKERMKSFEEVDLGPVLKVKILTSHAPTSNSDDEGLWGKLVIQTGDEKPTAEQAFQNENLVRFMNKWFEHVAKGDSESTEQPASPLDTQVGGSHYTEMPIQPFEYSMRNGLDPCQHTAIKYITRFRQKDGIKDLDKAIHTLQLLKHFESSK